MSLKDSEEWLSAFGQAGPGEAYELFSALNFWKDSVIDQLGPEKVFLHAKEENIHEWAAKGGPTDKPWSAEAGIFLLGSGLQHTSDVREFRKCFGFLYEEAVRSKLKAVFAAGMVFYCAFPFVSYYLFHS